MGIGLIAKVQKTKLLHTLAQLACSCSIPHKVLSKDPEGQARIPETMDGEEHKVVLKRRVMGGGRLRVEVVQPSEIVAGGVKMLVNSANPLTYVADAGHPAHSLLHLAN
jgi:hypothetical protein